MTKFTKADMGKEVVDKITGFKGHIVAIASYITGCDQVLVQPVFKKNQWQDQRWFDDDRLLLTGKNSLDFSPSYDSSYRGGPDRGAPIK